MALLNTFKPEEFPYKCLRCKKNDWACALYIETDVESGVVCVNCVSQDESTRYENVERMKVDECPYWEFVN